MPRDSGLLATGFRVQSQALLPQSCEAAESMWAGSGGIWPWFLSMQSGRKAASGRTMFACLHPGSFTAPIQATGPVPPRHMDGGEQERA